MSQENESWRARATAAVETSEAMREERDDAMRERRNAEASAASRLSDANEELAAALRAAKVETAEARAAAAAEAAAAAKAAAQRCEALKAEHAATLASVDERVKGVVEKLRGEARNLKSQLHASREREAALSRVLAKQAEQLLEGA